MKSFKRIMIWVVASVLFILIVINVSGYIISAPGYKGPESDHFNGKTFENLNEVKAKGLAEVLKWYLNRDQGEWYEAQNFVYGDKPVERIEGGKIKITFINHATFLIQVNGTNILTDPIWSERTSPVSFIGPKRYVPPGIQFDDLPEIDVVVISHNHYDHLDLPTIKKLEEKFQPHFYVPLGVSQFLTSNGVKKTTDMDWWETEGISEDIQLTCVPAQHFSGRGTYDRDETLWAGFVVKSMPGSIYFAGDSGYGDFFKNIGEKYGPFRVAMLPIGAYKPSWFMSPIHMSPEEAVRVHKEVRAQKSIGMHFGTFPLADDGRDAPVEDLQKAIEKHNLMQDEFVTLKNGESLILKR